MSQGNNRPRRSGGYSFRFSFGFNPVISAAVLIVSLLVIFASLSAQSSRTNSVTLDNFVSGIKNNDYSAIEIRDDGTVLGRPKTYLLPLTNTEFKLNTDDKTPVLQIGKGIREVKIEELFTLIKPSDSITSFLQQLGRAGSNGRFIELIVADDYLLAVQEFSGIDNLVVKNAGTEEFEQYLRSRDITITDLGIKVSFLNTASKAVNNEFIQQRYTDGLVDKVYQFDNFVVVRSKESRLSSDLVKWDYRLTDGLLNYLTTQGLNLDTGKVQVSYVNIPNINWGDVISLILIAVAIFFIFMLFRSMQGGGNGLMKFGQSKAKLLFGVKPDTTFADVAGVDEAKEELSEIVQFLKSPNKFLKMGARIPKGILMVGPPGTGKTLLARAIAGEAGVPFYHTSGSEFEEMLVGAGASRVRDLFEKAKKTAPSLIFIDEIDAVARKRGTTVQSSTTEQTLNQILTEMDGFEKNVNIIVIAATNRPDVLDPAILRPGRFDRRVVIDLPDLKGRKEILDIHRANKPLGPDVNIEKLAKRTVGFSGAELENVLNEAAIIAAKAGRKEITQLDIEEATNKTTMGPARKSRERTKRELKLVAVHEAGHAIVAQFAPEADPVHRISIVSRGMAGGVTEFLPENDENIITKTKLYSRIIVSLGGRGAEDIVLGDISTGASSDIEHATSIARRMVQKFGMSEKLGLIKYGDSNELQYLGYGYGEQRDYSDDTARMIDEEVRHLVTKAYAEVIEILKRERAKLDLLTEMLLEKEVVEGDEFLAIFGNKDKAE